MADLAQLRGSINPAGLKMNEMTISGLPQSISVLLKAPCGGSIKLFRISFDAPQPVRNRVFRNSQAPTDSTRFFTRATASVSKETSWEFNTSARSTSVCVNQVEGTKLPELRRAQRSLFRKNKGGRPRARHRRNVNRLHPRAANLRARLTWNRPVEYGDEARPRDVSRKSVVPDHPLEARAFHSNLDLKSSPQNSCSSLPALS